MGRKLLCTLIITLICACNNSSSSGSGGGSTNPGSQPPPTPPPAGLAIGNGPTSPAAKIAQPGDTNVEMLQLSVVTGPNDFVVLNNVTIQANGNGNDASDITEVALMEDANNNGIYDSGVDSIIGNGATFSSDNGTTAFPMFFIIGPSTTINFLVLYSFTTGINGTYYPSVNASGITALLGSTAGPAPVLGSAAGATVTIGTGGGGNNPPGGPGTWLTLAPMPTPRSDMTANVAYGQAYVIGGQQSGAPLSTIEFYDPLFDLWGTPFQSMPTARYGHAAGVDSLERIFVFGGTQTGTSSLPTVEMYEPLSQSWTSMPIMPTARRNHSVTYVGGEFYVAGGKNTGGALNSVDIFNPVTQTWRTGTGLPAGVSSAPAISDAFYGYIFTENLIFWGPVTNVWQTANGATFNPQSGAAVLNGSAYLMGGSPLGIPTQEVKTVPLTTVGGSPVVSNMALMPTARRNLAATAISGFLLPDLILAIGGIDASGQPSDVNEGLVP